MAFVPPLISVHGTDQPATIHRLSWALAAFDSAMQRADRSSVVQAAATSTVRSTRVMENSVHAPPAPHQQFSVWSGYDSNPTSAHATRPNLPLDRPWSRSAHLHSNLASPLPGAKKPIDGPHAVRWQRSHPAPAGYRPSLHCHPRPFYATKPDQSDWRESSR